MKNEDGRKGNHWAFIPGYPPRWENKVEKKKIFAEPYINNEIAVFKSENSRKFVVKLSSEHVITNLIIKA